MSDTGMPSTRVPQWATQVDVAVRQVRTAVRLFFEKCDPIPLHSLVAAAHELIAGLAANRGKSSVIGKSLGMAANFFQKTGGDTPEKLNLEPLSEITEDLLFDTVRTLQGVVAEIPFEAKIYWAWFMCTRPQEFQNCGPAIDSIIESNQHLNKMSFRGIRELLGVNQTLDTSEPLPEWCLIGPGPLTGGRLPPAGANNTEVPDDPSGQYAERVRALDGLARECCSVSQNCAGIPSPTSSHVWAAILFTSLCTRAVSLINLVPHSPWSIKLIEHWDYGSVASLTRSLLEIRLAFFYLGIEDCSQDEWYCRWNIFNVHDCESRIQMFLAEDSDYDVSGFKSQLQELRERLLGNSFFRSLPEGKQRQFLNGKVAYLSPLEEIAARAGVELNQFRWLYKFLSSHVQGFPMSRVCKILCARHSMRTWRSYATYQEEPGGPCRPACHSL